MSSKTKKPSKGSKSSTRSGPSDKRTNEPPVGYGKPPKHTQFQKGQSGNPGGRPKGSKNTRLLIVQIAEEETVKVTTANGEKEMPIKEMLAHKFLAMVGKGDFRFFKEFFTIEEEAQTELTKIREAERENEMDTIVNILSDMTFSGMSAENKKYFEDKYNYKIKENRLNLNMNEKESDD